MRSRLIEGKIDLPKYQAFLKVLGENDVVIADKFFTALWHAYLKDSTKSKVSLPYWAPKFSNAQNFNILLKSLSKMGWIVTNVVPARNWADAHISENMLLTYLTPDELEEVRAAKKFLKYTLKEEKPTSKTTATRLNGHVRNTGLVREGFAKAGNTRFTYDTNQMELYQDIIRLNLTKSMDKIAKIWPELRHDKASYDTISAQMLDHYMHTSEVFTRGENYNDSRGRAISSSLGKIGNPISCKDFRSLLVIE